jgi:hypothetical protein
VESGVFGGQRNHKRSGYDFILVWPDATRAFLSGAGLNFSPASESNLNPPVTSIVRQSDSGKKDILPMRRILVLSLFALIALCAGTGCTNKFKTPVAAEVEESFRTRWVAKRMGELQAGGMADAREARRMAVEEFKKKYEYTTTAKQIDPVNGTIQ